MDASRLAAGPPRGVTHAPDARGYPGSPPPSPPAPGPACWTGLLDRARTLLPAVLGEIRIQGPADVLIGYAPDPEHDIRAPSSPRATARPPSPPSVRDAVRGSGPVTIGTEP
ncbi:hypothetical protein ACFY9S_23400 [Streptomyces sp. NPDC012474]|uniref:hypothetical protein n=1 Tax=Streptomyces sp. NPDC012474 TaxID=3364836 RepID=UPI0036EE8E77